MDSDENNEKYNFADNRAEYSWVFPSKNYPVLGTYYWQAYFANPKHDLEVSQFFSVCP